VVWHLMFLPRVDPCVLLPEMGPVKEENCGSVFTTIVQRLRVMTCNCLHHHAEHVDTCRELRKPG
jgi:hypothetical protein